MKEEYLWWGRFLLSHLALIRLLGNKIVFFFGISEMLKLIKSNSQKTKDLTSKEINEKKKKKSEKESNMNFAISAPTYFNAVRINYEKV